MSSRRRLVMALVAVLVLSSCTGSEEPSPPVTETPQRTAAPLVEEPLDLQPIHGQPCSLLSTQQLADLEFPQGQDGAWQDEGENTNGSRYCMWSLAVDSPDSALYTLTIYLTRDPLSKAYQDNNARGGERKWAKFETHSVGGLPAVTQAPGNPESLCEVVVGTGVGQGISISGYLSVELEEPTLCERLVTAAELVIDAARK